MMSVATWQPRQNGAEARRCPQLLKLRRERELPRGNWARNRWENNSLSKSIGHSRKADLSHQAAAEIGKLPRGNSGSFGVTKAAGSERGMSR